MLRILIIDDEIHCAETLRLKLQKHCPDTEILGMITRPEEAEEQIRRLRPDVLFLDIEMPKLNGFDILLLTKDVPYEIIFSTAYDHYALKAIKHNALDYLLKPIDGKELEAAVQRARDRKTKGHDLTRIETLLSDLSQGKKLGKISVPSVNGIAYFEIDQIIRIAADGNYSTLYLVNNRKVTSTRTLKEYEQLLNDSHFFRVHSAHLVNLNFATNYIRGDGGTLVLSNGEQVEVARSKKRELLQLLG